MKYVVLRDEDTNQIELIGRFKENGKGEIWRNGNWMTYSNLISDMLDGLLESVSEIEAKKIIAEKRIPQFQAA